MKRKEKPVKKFVPYALWDFTGLQTWLNQQAQAGYALEKWPRSTFIGAALFRKDPSAVHARYCLDPLQEQFGASTLQEQVANYQEQGWRYVDQIRNLYAIYRCDDPQAPELYNDPDSLSWAMKKQVGWAWVSLLLWLVWAAVMFSNQWPRLLHEREAVVMELILQADLLIPLYLTMLALILNALPQGIGVIWGVCKVQASLRQGEWPSAGPRRYPEFCHNLIAVLLVVLSVPFLLSPILSDTLRPKILSGPKEWDFPHVTLQEILPAGAALRKYSPVDLLRNDTVSRSFLAPEQYDVAQGGLVQVGDDPQQDTRLYQESVQTVSPALAEAVYRGRVAAHHRSLELYRLNWEKNAPYLHPDLPNAYTFLEEEALTRSGLDGLTRFSYQYSDHPAANTVYIGWANERVFVLNCSGAADSEMALDLLVQRLAKD